MTTIRDICDYCENSKLIKQRIVKRYPVGILIGSPILCHHIKKCPICGREYHYEQLNKLVPPNGNYIYDIIIEVGLRRFRNFRQNKEIQKEIQNDYGIFLPEDSISKLADHFLDYFAAVHYAKFEFISKMINKQGGYVAHLDGTCEAGTDIFFVAVDEISKIVLLTKRIPTENVNDISNFLIKCKNYFGVPLATMCDLSSNIASARNDVFPNVTDFICQYHFLDNVGKALFEKTHQELTKLLRKLKIKSSLKSLRKDLVKRSKIGPIIQEKEFNEFIKNQDKQIILNNIQLRRHLNYFILRWIDDYSSELKGEYFPFVQSSLFFYKRCLKVYNLLSELLATSGFSKAIEKKTLISITRILEPLKNDITLNNIVHRLEKEVHIFEEFRDILRFKRQDNKPLLRNRPPGSTIKDALQAREKLNMFYCKIQKKINKNNDQVIVNCSKILIKYLDKYSDKLVGHIIYLPKQNQYILLDRTNNIAEQLFSGIKIGWRRKLGYEKLTRHLQAARHEEFLVTNLAQQDYIDVVYDGNLNNMPYYFAKYYKESFEIRKLRNLKEEKRNIPIDKKSLRQQNIILNIVHAFGKLLYFSTKNLK